MTARILDLSRDVSLPVSGDIGKVKVVILYRG
jgi:hypothetical protein